MVTFELEYAKSGRSKCRTCKSAIAKDEVRVGTTIYNSTFERHQTTWKHVACFDKPRRLALDDLEGFYDLEKVDQGNTKAFIFDDATSPISKSKKRKKSQKQASKTKRRKSSTKKKTRKRKKSSDEDSEESDSSDSDDDVNPEEMKVSQLKTALRSRGLSTSGLKVVLVKRLSKSLGDDGSDDESSEDEIDPKDVENDKNLYQQYKEEFSDMSVKELKELLQLNDQKKGGAKADLISRCVDAKMYGALPRCMECYAAVLRVKYKSRWGHKGQGDFTCPGYFDDDEFVRCQGRFKKADRTPWKDS